jgi:hypothetical protein
MVALFAIKVSGSAVFQSPLSYRSHQIRLISSLMNHIYWPESSVRSLLSLRRTPPPEIPFKQRNIDISVSNDFSIIKFGDIWSIAYQEQFSLLAFEVLIDGCFVGKKWPTELTRGGNCWSGLIRISQRFIQETYQWRSTFKASGPVLVGGVLVSIRSCLLSVTACGDFVVSFPLSR